MEKKIPAQEMDRKKNRASWKCPTPHHFSNGPSLSVGGVLFSRVGVLYGVPGKFLEKLLELHQKVSYNYMYM